MEEDSVSTCLWDTLHSILLHSVIQHFKPYFSHPRYQKQYPDCLNPHGLLCAFLEGSVWGIPLNQAYREKSAIKHSTTAEVFANVTAWLCPFGSWIKCWWSSGGSMGVTGLVPGIILSLNFRRCCCGPQMGARDPTSAKCGSYRRDIVKHSERETTCIWHLAIFIISYDFIWFHHSSRDHPGLGGTSLNHIAAATGSSLWPEALAKPGADPFDWATCQKRGERRWYWLKKCWRRRTQSCLCGHVVIILWFGLPRTAIWIGRTGQEQFASSHQALHESCCRICCC